MGDGNGWNGGMGMVLFEWRGKEDVEGGLGWNGKEEELRGWEWRKE